jgi:hypothetical protein
MDPHTVVQILSDPQFQEPILSTIVTKSVNELIDDAIESLPPFRRGMVKRNLARNPAKREEIADRVLMRMSEDERISPVMGAGFAAGIASGAITASTPVGIDVDKLKQIMDLIFEYLPKILQLLSLFMSVAWFLIAILAVASTGSTALAQGGNCANGVCSLGSRVSAVVGLQSVSDTSPRVATSPLSPRIAAVAPAVSAVVNQARPVAFIANTRQRFESKPVRSFIGSRPILRVRPLLRR